MENLTPQQEHEPNEQDPKMQTDGPGGVNDRPKTPNDGYSDQGTTAEELEQEEQKSTNAEESEIPELNPDRNDVEVQKPTAFDIDESTG